MAPVCAYLRLQGIRVFPYLDDWLLVATSQDEASRNTRLTLDLLGDLGLCINREKSQLEPVQVIPFIGTDIDSRRARAYLPVKRVDAILRLTKMVCSK